VHLKLYEEREKTETKTRRPAATFPKMLDKTCKTKNCAIPGQKLF